MRILRRLFRFEVNIWGRDRLEYFATTLTNQTVIGNDLLSQSLLPVILQVAYLYWQVSLGVGFFDDKLGALYMQWLYDKEISHKGSYNMSCTVESASLEPKFDGLSFAEQQLLLWRLLQQSTENLLAVNLALFLDHLKSSMTLVPNPLKFLRPHYGTLKSFYESMPESDLKKLLAGILSVLALTMSADGQPDSLRYLMLGSKGDISSWGHEYVRITGVTYKIREHGKMLQMQSKKVEIKEKKVE